MGYSNLNKAIARIIALQRIELASPTLKRLRKIFGRYLFTQYQNILYQHQKSI